jgi:hypothetical protein
MVGWQCKSKPQMNAENADLRFLRSSAAYFYLIALTLSGLVKRLSANLWLYCTDS